MVKTAETLNRVADQLKKTTGSLQKLADDRPRGGGNLMYSIGGTPKDSESYSFLKVARFAKGLDPKGEGCKYERHVHDILMKSYDRGMLEFQGKSFLTPFALEHLVSENDEQDRLIGELKQKFYADKFKYVDPDQVAWLRTKALGTTPDTAGGHLVGFPSLGELIELQRNVEAFVNAGAAEISLGPNGRMQLPKLTGGCTAYWVGEGAASTTSQQTTGSLDLVAKKLAIRVPLNNELLKFNLIGAEAMVREDMARQGALKIDKTMLETGVGGTSPKALITYQTATAWTQGTDKLITHTASKTGTDGNTLQPEDASLMINKMPDGIMPTAWIMRRDFWGAYKNRRGDAVATGDAKGQFVFNQFRLMSEMLPDILLGVKVVPTSQVSNTREKGSATNLTYALLGNFRDWVIGRAGVMEIEANPWGDTAWQNYQTELRAIQFVDAGPRHAASFVWCDQLINA